ELSPRRHCAHVHSATTGVDPTGWTLWTTASFLITAACITQQSSLKLQQCLQLHSCVFMLKMRPTHEGT
ncbi:hypothetical protein NDU88_003545, partial [Pleurodeles waltl]